MAQATVEGLAVPLAIGVSGVVLLGVQAVGGTEGLMLPLLTAAVVSAWVAVAVLLYREYRSNLLANLRGRTLDPAGLTVEEESGFIAIDRLVESDDERDVWLGLDILTTTGHAELPARLGRLVMDERENVRTDALERLMAVDPDAAAASARGCLDDPSPAVRAAAVRALGAAGTPADLAGIAACSSDDAPEVRVAVAAALSRVGDEPVRAGVAAGIAQLGRSAPRRIGPWPRSCSARCSRAPGSNAPRCARCSPIPSPTW